MVQIRSFFIGFGGLTVHGTCLYLVFVKLLDAIISEVTRGRTPLRNTSEALRVLESRTNYNDDQKASNCAFVALVLRVI